jgi:hypothetical protein
MLTPSVIPVSISEALFPTSSTTLLRDLSAQIVSRFYGVGKDCPPKAVALLLPAFNKARQAAFKVACASNLHQIDLARRMYHDDWRMWPTGWKPLLAYTENNEGVFHCLQSW